MSKLIGFRGYLSFYGEDVFINDRLEVIADGMVIDEIKNLHPELVAKLLEEIQ